MGFESRGFAVTDGLFLGVENSATGRAGATGSTSAARRARSRSRSATILPELLARILAGRNVEVDAVEAFLDPTIKRSMPDPNVLTAMPEAAARIADAIVRGESVAIFGDYDVDGATSAALLARFLRHAGIDPIDPHSRPPVRRLRPECRGGARARRARRHAPGHRRLRHDQHRAAGRGAGARRRCRRHRSPSGRRGAAAGGRHRQSEPARRSFRARPSRRRRARRS